MRLPTHPGRKRARLERARAAVRAQPTFSQGDGPSGSASASMMDHKLGMTSVRPETPLYQGRIGAVSKTRLGEGSGQGRGARYGAGIGKAAEGGGSSGSGNGNGCGGETMQARYLREQFAYIRERIRRELRYPPKALRAGWSGRVPDVLRDRRERQGR